MRVSAVTRAACEHGFVTAQPRSAALLERALRSGNANLALLAAAELARVELDDALAITLLLRDDPRRYERAAIRWAARYVSEQEAVTLEEARVLVEALLELGAGMPGEATRRSASSSGVESSSAPPRGYPACPDRGS